MSGHNSLPIRDEAFSGSDNALAKGVVRPVATFLGRETAAGILLIIFTAIALIWANVDFSSYDDFWHTKLSLTVGEFELSDTLAHWVNDALMALFFFVVGMEIKSELVLGDLKNPKIAALPAIGALGGMIVPAAFYFALNPSGPEASGWGIPMATDIAFAVGVLALVGNKVPKQLSLFLLTLAIVDDIGAIIVIAIFYSKGFSAAWLGWAVAGLLLMFAMQKQRVWFTPLYVILGVFVWFATFESGVHATIAGVALGLLTPARPLIPRESLSAAISGDKFESSDFGAIAVRDAQFQVRETVGVCERMIKLLSPFTSYIIIPIFALANAGIPLSGEVIGDALTSSVTLGIIAGLVVGKPLGVYVFAMAALASGVATLPAGMRKVHILAVGAVAGIGFTVALFINGLAFSDDVAIRNQATIGILLASLLATLLGFAIIKLSHSDEDATPEGDARASMVDADADGQPDFATN